MELRRLRGPFSDPQLHAWWPVLAVLVLDQLTQNLASAAPLGPVVAAAFSLAQGLPLRWRNRAPLAAAAGVLAASLAQVLLTGPTVSFGAWFAALVAAFATGSWSSGARSWFGLAGVVVGLSVVGFLGQPDSAPVEVVFPLVYGAAAWGVGRLTRTRRMTAERLADLVEQLATERAHAEQLAVEAAQARISREVHDIVAHGLGIIVVQAEAAGALLERDPAALARPITLIQDTAREALSEVRRMLTVLRDGPLEVPQPGLGDIRRLVEQFQASGLPVALHLDGEQRPVPDDLGLTVYRLVQEALTNTLRHAPGASAVVTVDVRAGEVEVRVTDDGQSALGLASRGGHGLLGMRERVAVFGGSIEVGRQHGGGFGLAAVLPVQGVSS